MAGGWVASTDCTRKPSCDGYSGSESYDRSGGSEAYDGSGESEAYDASCESEAYDESGGLDQEGAVVHSVHNFIF